MRTSTIGPNQERDEADEHYKWDEYTDAGDEEFTSSKKKLVKKILEYVYPGYSAVWCDDCTMHKKTLPNSLTNLKKTTTSRLS